jgi:hypothetical protein
MLQAVLEEILDEDGGADIDELDPNFHPEDGVPRSPPDSGNEGSPFACAVKCSALRDLVSRIAGSSQFGICYG